RARAVHDEDRMALHVVERPGYASALLSCEARRFLRARPRAVLSNEVLARVERSAVDSDRARRRLHRIDIDRQRGRVLRRNDELAVLDRRVDRRERVRVLAEEQREPIRAVITRLAGHEADALRRFGALARA